MFSKPLDQNRFSKTDSILAVLLGLAALLLRLPFRSRYLYHWDSVNFALSLEQYDVRLHQPHPPGYFLYSMVGRAFNLFFNNPNASLVWLSLIAGVIGVAAIYICGAKIFDRRTGLIAALILIVNPMHWFYSDVALSYSLEFALIPFWIVLCYRQVMDKNGSGNTWLYCSVLLGLMGGVRQNDLVFLLPLWLFCLLSLSWNKRLLSCLVLGLVMLLWLVPMVLLSGGVQGYLAALLSETSGVVDESPFSSTMQLVINAGRLLIYLGYAVLLGVIPLVWQLFAQNLAAWKKSLADKRTWIFLLWIAPAFLFYVFIHIRQPGHIFIFFPAIILIMGRATDLLGRRLDGALQKLVAKARSFIGTIPVVGAVVLANLAFFVFAPPALFGSTQLALQTPSRQTIQQHDTFLEERFRYIREHFKPGSTAIIAGGLNFRHPDFYLRDYQVTNLSYRLGEEPVLLPTNVNTLVIFDRSVLSGMAVPGGFQTVAFPETSSALYYLSWNKNQQVFMNIHQVEINGKK